MTPLFASAYLQTINPDFTLWNLDAGKTAMVSEVFETGREPSRATFLTLALLAPGSSHTQDH